MSEHEIVIGITGGIAAYKTAQLVSRLVQADFGTRVVMTESAHQFIGQTTLTALTGRSVVTGMFDDASQFPLGPHIELARQADLLCVAPATANFLGKAANGIADDLLSTLLLCFTGPILLAPAMNCEMWENAAVQRNVQRLRTDGLHIVEPETGWLSCRVEGTGRMADPDTLFNHIQSILEPAQKTKS